MDTRSGRGRGSPSAWPTDGLEQPSTRLAAATSSVALVPNILLLQPSEVSSLPVLAPAIHSDDATCDCGGVGERPYRDRTQGGCDCYTQLTASVPAQCDNSPFVYATAARRRLIADLARQGQIQPCAVTCPNALKGRLAHENQPCKVASARAHLVRTHRHAETRSSLVAVMARRPSSGQVAPARWRNGTAAGL